MDSRSSLVRVEASFLGGFIPYIYVRVVRVLVAKPSLELRACCFLCTSNALDGFAEASVEQEHGYAVGLREIVENVFRSGRNRLRRFFSRVLTSSYDNRKWNRSCIRPGRDLALDFHDFGDDGLAAQLRIVPLLDGSVEWVHVDVHDFAHWHVWTILGTARTLSDNFGASDRSRGLENPSATSKR